MIGTSHTGIIWESNKVLQSNIQHEYDYAWKMVTWVIPTNPISYVTSKLQLV